jgi:hypothetical protein
VTRRHIHYEAAFEDYLRSRGLPYVAVDQQRKAIFAGARIKSFDFLVYPPAGKAWLVDVKGRKFPYVGPSGKRYWENWVTLDDLEGLAQWQQAFGEEFEARLVFAYWLTTCGSRLPTAQVHSYQGQHYGFFSISLDDFAQHCRPRSSKWRTVALPVKLFRQLARPMPVVDDRP